MKHKIIYTNDYALIVSDEEIKKYNFVFNPIYKTLYQWIENADIHFDRIDAKKVIAHHPLKDAPILEGVPWLPKFSQEEDVEDLALAYSSSKECVNPEGYSDKQVGLLHGFIDGYNKAKETYKYTEENLRECCSLIFNALGVGDDITTDEIIQHIQQPKRPKYFECEIEDTFLLKNRKGGNTIMAKPKTITNSQGQTELVGEYSYE